MNFREDAVMVCFFTLVAVGFCALVGFAIVSEVRWSRYAEAHHCAPNGKARPGPWVYVQKVMIPTTEFQYVCDGGDEHWR